jgi:hypothetical protein
LVWNAIPSITPTMSTIRFEHLADAFHRRDDLPHDFAALARHSARAAGELAGRDGAVGVLAHRLAEFGHRGRRLLERGGLLLGARAEVAAAVGDLGRGRRHALGIRARVADEGGQIALHRREHFHQVSELVPASAVHARGEIAD